MNELLVALGGIFAIIIIGIRMAHNYWPGKQERVPRTSGNYWRKRGVLLPYITYTGSFIGWFFGLMGASGVTWNREVHITFRHKLDYNNPSTIRLLAHEQQHHVEQMYMGWHKYLVEYVKLSPAYIGRMWEHPMEKEAYAVGDSAYAAWMADRKGAA